MAIFSLPFVVVSVVVLASISSVLADPQRELEEMFASAVDNKQLGEPGILVNGADGCMAAHKGSSKKDIMLIYGQINTRNINNLERIVTLQTLGRAIAAGPSGVPLQHCEFTPAMRQFDFTYEFFLTGVDNQGYKYLLQTIYTRDGLATTKLVVKEKVMPDYRVPTEAEASSSFEKKLPKLN